MSKNILLINLGSPKSLAINDVKNYLKEFLSDDYVIDLPKFLQQIILRCFILPFRTPKTKRAYQSIWDSNGSPLIHNTNLIAKSLNKKTGWNVQIAMRYQQPSIKNSILTFKNNQINDIIILPLYPHNAMSTTKSTEKAISAIVKKYHPDLRYKLIEPFYNHPKYINALAEQIKPNIKNKYDKLIFSYHGLPERHIRKSDSSGKHCLFNSSCCDIDCVESKTCYRSNVLKTSKLIANKLALNDYKWMVTFQSRVTIIDRKWLKPFTDIELMNFPKNNINNIVILCPSFVADCLETLEEINIRERESFFKAGGKKFTYIPCLNNDQNFIEFLEELIIISSK
tara:strand:- start:14999 stop:16018 length:1020 start_codon:yes stop_codon:yes gene_type:complete